MRKYPVRFGRGCSEKGWKQHLAEYLPYSFSQGHGELGRKRIERTTTRLLAVEQEEGGLFCLLRTAIGVFSWVHPAYGDV